VIPKARLVRIVSGGECCNPVEAEEMATELLNYQWRDAKVEHVPLDTTVRLKLNGKLGVGSYYMDNDGSWESPVPDYEAWVAYWDNDPGMIDDDFNPYEHDLVEWCYLPPLPE
jgi:hypothetical protein